MNAWACTRAVLQMVHGGMHRSPRGYIGSVSASPTTSPLRRYGGAGTQNDRLGVTTTQKKGTEVRKKTVRTWYAPGVLQLAQGPHFSPVSGTPPDSTCSSLFFYTAILFF